MKGRTVKLMVAGLLALLFPTMLLISACTKKAEEPLKIGGIFDLTGNFSFYGQDFKDAVQFAVEEAGGKVAGRPVKLLIEDGASDAAINLDKAKKLVEHDKVHITIGPLMSHFAMGTAPYFAEKKVPNIALLMHPKEMTKYEWVFTQCGPLVGLGYAAGLYAYEEMGARTSAIVGVDYVAGHRIVGGFIQAFKDKGGKVVQEQWAPLGTVDYAPYISAINRDVDVIGAWLIPQVPFLMQYAEFGLKLPLIAPYADLREQEMQELGDRIQGQFGANVYSWQLDNPVNKKFVKAFEAKYGRKPTMNDAAAYDAASIALAAFKATGGDTSGEALRQAIQAMEIELPSGHVTYAPSRFGIRNMYIFKVKRIEGKMAWAPVHTYHQDPDKLPLLAER
jgi:branched-chain amino acid transport system substrate-binding protein